MMVNICLIIEYDGTDYAGWQYQPNGLSVQQVVEEKLHQLLGEPVRLISSGRTDAGVHARGMVANFHAERELPLSAYREGLNRLLPADIVVRESHIVEETFHSRFAAQGKWYRYTIYQSPVRSALFGRYCWHLRHPLEEERMRQAAFSFVGVHDFCAFRTSGCDARSTTREIFSVEILREGDFIHVDIQGSGFLRNMVRIMVGTLVQIGSGKRPATDIKFLLQGEGELRSGPTAPAQGLCLMQVWYGTETERFS